MIYPVDFVKMAGMVNHINFAIYLRDLGWENVKVNSDVLTVFQKENGNDFFQADIPKDRNLSDYDQVMYRAIEEVAKCNKRSTEEVLLELINPTSDIVKIRLKNEELEAGSIYVEDAINLYENTKKLITAAAMDVLNPKPWHRGNVKQEVQDFISHCRFGQTEIGSYIISVACPIHKSDQMSLFDKDEGANSLTRRTINQLLFAAQTVKNDIDDGGFDESFLEKRSISVNFLEALDQVGICKSKTEVDLSVKWAPTVQQNRSEVNSVVLTSDYSQSIKFLTSKVKSRQSEEKSYIGKIKDLSSETDVKKRNGGVITFVFINDSKKRSSAKVQLSTEDYYSAMEAHKKGANVKIFGVLSEESSKKKIECGDFSVLDD